MKKIAAIFFLLLCIKAKSQLDFADYYTEKDLLANLQKAKSPAEQLDATGMVMAQYAIRFKDSLAAAYMDKIYKIAENSGDVKLKAQAILWDKIYKFDTLKVNRLLQFALQQNLVEYKIAAKLILSEYYIHHDQNLSEKNGLDAKKYWEDWKTDSVSKDSLKLKIYRVLSHVYIHKRDGINVSQYLLPLIDYASQDRNESLKIDAMDVLASMYSEWPGKKKVATDWVARLYEYYKKRNKKNQLLMMAGWLGQQMSILEDKEKAKVYFNEVEKLMDSLGVYGYFQVYQARSKYYANVITLSQYMNLLDNNFNGRLFLPQKEIVGTKIGVYNDLKSWDSVMHYLLQYKKIIGDSSAREDNLYKFYLAEYYTNTKQFDLAIPIVKDFLRNDEKRNNLEGQKDNCWWLKELYAEKSDHKTAYEYFVRWEKLREDLEYRENKEGTASMNMQKQIELQQASFEEQKKSQQAEQEKAAFKSSVRFYGLLAGIAILLLVAGLLWRNNRQKQKAKAEIEKSYANLKSTQQQLIQSEKMASLGELTAGIAHEIQNPLNFVNNFSEVNDELLKELRTEAEKGNLEEVKTIANDIAFNSEKINHHGKRADAIVKGMLQHSRVSSGQKEPTDINALADEYLRLAYHGLRAKDKSFNVELKTDFDNSIGKINVVPQEVGRVILNLINNAFYAIDEKRKQNLNARLPDGQGYEPIVMVSTRTVKLPLGGLGAEIRVKDNGNGVPPKVLDKIFQPFFTTKPTGQGTGLGLSLSYDIVRAHGGELKVETKEGEGALFIMQIPA